MCFPLQQDVCSRAEPVVQNVLFSRLDSFLLVPATTSHVVHICISLENKTKNECSRGSVFRSWHNILSPFAVRGVLYVLPPATGGVQ